MNPFKFGTIVKEPFFTDRIKEIKKITGILKSENHLIVIAPRRYGKSSLIYKATEALKRPVITLDLQLITSVHDLAAQLLKRIYRIYPFERVRQYVKHFRIVPSISMNPVTNSVEISFNPGSEKLTMLEDVLNIMEKLSKKNNRLIVVFDEFQEITRIEVMLLRQFRSIMQLHQKINYVFLGSQESLIREIFEKKKSPFYQFGLLIPLAKISEEDLSLYLNERFRPMTRNYANLTKDILAITHCHPHYTQQLAFMAWEKVKEDHPVESIVKQSVTEIIESHDVDFERIWARFNITDKKMLIALVQTYGTVLSEEFLRSNDLGASSTAYSSLMRLSRSGYIIKEGNRYELDDPFFRLWIRRRREV